MDSDAAISAQRHARFHEVDNRALIRAHRPSSGTRRHKHDVIHQATQLTKHAGQLVWGTVFGAPFDLRIGSRIGRTHMHSRSDRASLGNAHHAAVLIGRRADGAPTSRARLACAPPSPSATRASSTPPTSTGHDRPRPAASVERLCLRDCQIARISKLAPSRGALSLRADRRSSAPKSRIGSADDPVPRGVGASTWSCATAAWPGRGSDGLAPSQQQRHEREERHRWLLPDVAPSDVQVRLTTKACIIVDTRAKNVKS